MSLRAKRAGLLGDDVKLESERNTNKVWSLGNRSRHSLPSKQQDGFQRGTTSCWLESVELQPIKMMNDVNESDF